MKVCSTCNQRRRPNSFHWRDKKKGIKHVRCKFCQKKATREHHISEGYREKKRILKRIRIDRNRNYIIDYLKENPCVNCGETDIILLEFDHISTETKRIILSEAVCTGYSLNYIKEEISNCQVLCVSCHRKKTARDHGNYKLGR